MINIAKYRYYQFASILIFKILGPIKRDCLFCKYSIVFLIFPRNSLLKIEFCILA